MHQERLDIEIVVKGAIDENRGALVAFVGQVGERLILADGFFAWGVDGGEQMARVIFARQPLDEAVVIAREGRNFGGEKRIHVSAPAGSCGGSSGSGRFLGHGF